MSLEIPLYGDDASDYQVTNFGGDSDSDLFETLNQNVDNLNQSEEHDLDGLQNGEDRIILGTNSNVQLHSDSDVESAEEASIQTQENVDRIQMYENGQFSSSSDNDDNDDDQGSGSDADDSTNFIDYAGRGKDFLKQNPPQWTEEVQRIDVQQFRGNTPGPKLPDNWDYNSGPLEYFKLLFPDEVTEKIVMYTNGYAIHAINLYRQVSPTYIDPDWALDGTDNVSKEEILAYFGGNLIFGINPAKRLKNAFSSDPYINNEGLRSHFTLKRFLKIGNYFSCCDKSNEKPKGHPQYDKLYKVRLLVDHCNAVFPKYYNFSDHIALDESIIKTKSRLDNIVFCAAKPVRRGIKVFSLCDSKNPKFPYLLKFEPYLGKNCYDPSIDGNTFDTVVRLVQDLFGTYARLYVDNYYTSVPLFCHLLKQKVYCVGTLRHRLGLPQPIRKHKKMVRGKHRVWQDANNRNLTCTLWQDTKLVSFLSTCTDPTVVTHCTRRINREYRRLSQPSSAHAYSKHYKAIDLMDCSVRNFCSGRKSVRSSKYYVTFCFDALINNAYILFLMTSTKPRPKNYSQMYFRLDLAKALLGNFTCRKYEPVVQPMYIGPDAPSLDLRNHPHGKLPNLKGPRVCKTHKKYFNTKKRTRLGCIVCKISICVDCHILYHNQ